MITPGAHPVKRRYLVVSLYARLARSMISPREKSDGFTGIDDRMGHLPPGTWSATLASTSAKLGLQAVPTPTLTGILLAAVMLHMPCTPPQTMPCMAPQKQTVRLSSSRSMSRMLWCSSSIFLAPRLAALRAVHMPFARNLVPTPQTPALVLQALPVPHHRLPYLLTALGRCLLLRWHHQRLQSLSR